MVLELSKLFIFSQVFLPLYPNHVQEKDQSFKMLPSLFHNSFQDPYKMFQNFGKQIERFVVGKQNSHYGQIDSQQQQKIWTRGKEARIIPAQSTSFIVDGFYQSVFDNPEYNSFSPLNAIIENFPSIGNIDNVEKEAFRQPEGENVYEENNSNIPSYVLEIINNVEEHSETNSDNVIAVDNPLRIILNYNAESSDDEDINVAQEASADVPDQNNPEKYTNSDRDTLDRVIDTPLYYRDIHAYRANRNHPNMISYADFLLNKHHFPGYLM